MTVIDGGLKALPNPFLLDQKQSETVSVVAMSTDGRSARDLRLADLVAKNAVSVRLAYSIAAAADTGSLPFDTVGEYLDAAEEASAILCATVRDFGEKTSRELATLINEECARHPRPWVKADADSEVEIREARRSELLSLFASETIGEFVSGEHVSVRLSNVLARPEFRDRPLTDVFDASVFTIASMMRISNLGRKSIDEFRSLCARLVARRFRAEGFDPLSCEAGAQTLLGGMEAVSLVVEAYKIADMKGDVPSHRRLSERMEWLLSELDPKSADIVKRRYGIGHEATETLEEIGTRLFVTRERIRQIEAKSLRQLQMRTLKAPLRHLINEEAAAAWRTLSQDGSHLLREEVQARKKFLDPSLCLALEIAGMPLAEWIDEIAAPYPLGWHVSEANRKAIEEASRILAQKIESLPIPRAVDGFDPALEGRDVTSACYLVLGLTVKGGYVMPPRVGARLLRVVGLHAILSNHNGGLSLVELLSDYHTRFPRDLCTGRDAEIVMEAASHLFIELDEGHWAALGIGGVLPPPLAAKRDPRILAEEPGTIAAALQGALLARGPTRLGDLLDGATEILPKGRSIRSIGPILLTRGELFVRLLPGVYGLPEHLAMASDLPEDAPYLLNDNQARLYCLARFAGEAREAFPFWNSHNEYRLCKWARHSGNQTIFNSLLAVADIGLWHLSDEQKEEWAQLKARSGRFELSGILRRDAVYERPDLERVLAACLYAENLGSLNWMAVNRVCGRKIDSQGGIGMIALLLRLGALAGSESRDLGWLRPHPTSPEIGRVILSLSNEMSADGVLCWDSAIGKKLAECAEKNTIEPVSWIDPEAFGDMLGGRLLETPMEDVDPVEELLALHRLSRDAAKREERLQWLLADA